MALQTLNTIKQWFKTGLKPTQTQFWDTWDSFRHKYDKVPVKDVDGLDELLLSKAEKAVLDNHLADKNAHAPQVNTDWNSDSGFSQLLNRPEFKTINGKSVVGDGDITVKEGGSQNLDETLANGNSTNKEIILESNGGDITTVNNMGVLLRGNGGTNSSLDGLGFFTVGTNGLAYMENKGQITVSHFGGSTIQMRDNEIAHTNIEGNSSFLQFDNSVKGHFVQTIPPKTGTIALLEDIPEEKSQGLQSVLDTDPTATYGASTITMMGEYRNSKYNEITVSDETERTSIFQSNNQLSFDNTSLNSNDLGNITLSEGNIRLTRDKSSNQTIIDIADPVANTQLKFPAKSEESKTYTLATTDDFKTINGKSIVGEGDITIKSGDFISGTPNTISKFNSKGDGLEDSLISDDKNKVLITKKLEIDSTASENSGLKFTNLKNDVTLNDPITITTGIKGNTNDSVIDSQGNIYLYEEIGGTSIYKINSFTNIVTVVATLPSRVDGIKVANSDNVYFTYYTSEGTSKTSIGRISVDGIVSDIALEIDGYYSKMALDTDTEDIYLTMSNKIIKITSSGLVSDFIPSISAEAGVECMAVDYNHNLILVLTNAVIVKVTPDGTQSTLTTLDSPSSPRAILIDKNNTIYTANYYSDNIAVISQTGETSYIGNIGEYNAELAMDNDGNFLTVAHNARKLYLTTPEGVSRILGNTSEFPRLPLVNSKNEIFVSNYYGEIQKYTKSYKGALTVDENGNVVLYNNKDIEGSQNLQQTLDNGNETSKNAIFKSNRYTTIINASDISVSEPTVGTTSIQPSNIQLLNPSGNAIAILKGDGLSLYDTQGQNSARLISNPESTHSGDFKFPLKTNSNESQTLVTTEDFKTINGESIIGEGDVTGIATTTYVNGLDANVIHKTGNETKNGTLTVVATGGLVPFRASNTTGATVAEFQGIGGAIRTTISSSGEISASTGVFSGNVTSFISPTQPEHLVTKSYADGLVVGLLNDRGSYNASTNVYPSTGGSGAAGAIKKGNIWAINTVGTLGGVSVTVGDWIRALTDSPGQTVSNWSVVKGNFGYVPANDSNVMHKLGSIEESVTGNKTFTGVLFATPSNPAYTAFVAQSGTSIAVAASSNGGQAIVGTSVLSTGVTGSSTSGNGFAGVSGTGIGSVSISDSGIGSVADTRIGTKISSFKSNAIEKAYINNTGGYVKTGGLSTEYLKADGSVSTLINPITGTGNAKQIPVFVNSGGEVKNSRISVEESDINNPKIYIQASNTNGTASYGFDIGGIKTADIQSRGDGTETGSVIMRAHSSGVLKDIMILKGNGNVLVGTAIDSGTAKLQVNGTITASPATIGTELTTLDQITAILPTSGLYTPTISNGPNSSNSSLSRASYIKVGNVVTVSFNITTTPTSTSSGTNVIMTLPVNKATNNIKDVGSGTAVINATFLPVRIQSQSLSTVNLIFFATSLSSSSMSGTFQYSILE